MKECEYHELDGAAFYSVSMRSARSAGAHCALPFPLAFWLV